MAHSRKAGFRADGGARRFGLQSGVEACGTRSREPPDDEKKSDAWGVAGTASVAG